MTTEPLFIYGKHAVKEALKMRPDTVRAVFVEHSTEDPELDELIKKSKISKQAVSSRKFPKDVPQGAVHQGVVAEIDSTKLVVAYDDFIHTQKITNDTVYVLLGEVNDPHNVGAVIRSAAAFGAAGVLIPEHRQVQINGTVVKVSVGMAFHIPLVSVGNVNNTIADLKERGFWIYGLDPEAEQSLPDEQFEKPSVIVLGNEADGIRKKTLEHCDIPLRIPTVANVESLNASVAAAIVLYAWSNKHQK